jgi:hypothetical protein
VGVHVAVGVSVGVAVGVSVGVLVGVLVSVGVAVGVSVAVGGGVGVSVGVAVGVSVGVLVGASVGVLVGVQVAVAVGVSVGVAVAVAVLVAVAVGVTVAVGVGTIGCSVTLAWSSVASGSGWSAAVISTVLTMSVTPSTRAVMKRRTVAPLASAGTLQRPVLSLNVPASADDDSVVRPAGGGSSTTMPLAGDGPLFVSPMVYTTVVPTRGVVVVTLLVRLRSADDTIVTVSLASLLAAFDSPPPLTLAVLVRLPGAVDATCTGRVIAGAPLPPLTASVRRQVTV